MWGRGVGISLCVCLGVGCLRGGCVPFDGVDVGFGCARGR